MPRQLLVGTFFALPGLLVGYLLATAWLDQTLARPVDYLTLARLLPDLWAASPDLALQIALIIACSTLGFFLFGAHNASEGLTTLGTSSWQTPRQMRRNGLLGKPGKGFVLALPMVRPSKGLCRHCRSAIARRRKGTVCPPGARPRPLQVGAGRGYRDLVFKTRHSPGRRTASNPSFRTSP